LVVPSQESKITFLFINVQIATVVAKSFETKTSDSGTVHATFTGAGMEQISTNAGVKEVPFFFSVTAFGPRVAELAARDQGAGVLLTGSLQSDMYEDRLNI
jgi:single-stranded DNA-binding protein